jgi:hypothetical protein
VDSLRLVRVAGGFSRYDARAIKQINRTIELIRYRRFGNKFLIDELVAPPPPSPSPRPGPSERRQQWPAAARAAAPGPSLTDWPRHRVPP